MSLVCKLSITKTTSHLEGIGTLEIQRHEPLDLTDPAAIVDVVSTYTVRLDGQDRGTVRHRYGDGAWVLLAKAAALVAGVRLAAPSMSDGVVGYNPTPPGAAFAGTWSR